MLGTKREAALVEASTAGSRNEVDPPRAFGTFLIRSRFSSRFRNPFNKMSIPVSSAEPHKDLAFPQRNSKVG